MKINNQRYINLALFAVVMIGGTLFLGRGSAFAATKTWTGDGTDSNFSTSANWSPSGAPSDGDDLVFDLSDLGTFSTPNNDIAGLSINSINADNGTDNQLFSIVFEEDTTLLGDVVNSGANKITIDGGFILGADVTISGGITLGDHPSSLNKITLDGYTLAISDYDGITAVDVPMEGDGAVNYDNLAQLQIGGGNTYSGTTNFTNVAQAFESYTPPYSPTEMFGTSALVVDANSRVELAFSASETFSNQITLADTTVDGNTFNAQLSFSSEQVSASHAIVLPNVILEGDGGMTLSPSQIASVDLEGIQANGHCLYVPTAYQENFLNTPVLCGGSGNSASSVDKVPGVPDTGTANESYQKQLLALVALVSGLIAGASIVRHRISNRA